MNNNRRRSNSQINNSEIATISVELTVSAALALVLEHREKCAHLAEVYGSPETAAGIRSETEQFSETQSAAIERRLHIGRRADDNPEITRGRDFVRHELGF